MSADPDALSDAIRAAVYSSVSQYVGVALEGRMATRFRRDVMEALMIEIRCLGLNPPEGRRWGEILGPLVDEAISALSERPPS